MSVEAWDGGVEEKISCSTQGSRGNYADITASNVIALRPKGKPRLLPVLTARCSPASLYVFPTLFLPVDSFIPSVADFANTYDNMAVSVGILSIGDMGLGMARLLQAHGYRVLTVAAGRRYVDVLLLCVSR